MLCIPVPSVEEEIDVWNDALSMVPDMSEECRQAITNHVQSLEKRNDYLKELEYEQAGRFYSENSVPEETSR